MNQTYHFQNNHRSESITVFLGKKELTVPWWFLGDGYTGVPDLPDSAPCRVHDWAYERQTWDDGTRITRLEADQLLYMMMIGSNNTNTQDFAACYYWGVRWCGWMFWKDKWTPKPEVK